MELLCMQGVTKRYRNRAQAVYALDGVSFSADRGEFIAVTGPSGSGKSTLMNLLGCLDVPDEGEYLIGGKNAARLSERALSAVRGRTIGFVFQSFHLIGGLSALENVELPLMLRGIRKAERRRLAEQALEQVGLGHRLHHKPAELSGGQQQRVAIARAVSARPPLILADEPTGNLDPEAGAEVMRILRRLHADGHTVMLITHDPALAATADRILRMRDGRIEEDRRQGEWS